MRQLKIPSAFYLFGQRIVVEWSDSLVDDTDCLGMARFRKNRIRLQRGDTATIRRPREATEQVFLHELCHWILHLLGQEELDHNEALVDNIASLLHQALVTAEYK